MVRRIDPQQNRVPWLADEYFSAQLLFRCLGLIDPWNVFKILGLARIPVKRGYLSSAPYTPHPPVSSCHHMSSFGRPSPLPLKWWRHLWTAPNTCPDLFFVQYIKALMSLRFLTQYNQLPTQYTASSSRNAQLTQLDLVVKDNLEGNFLALSPEMINWGGWSKGPRH